MTALNRTAKTCHLSFKPLSAWVWLISSPAEKTMCARAQKALLNSDNLLFHSDLHLLPSQSPWPLSFSVNFIPDNSTTSQIRYLPWSVMMVSQLAPAGRESQWVSLPSTQPKHPDILSCQATDSTPSFSTFRGIKKKTSEKWKYSHNL